MEIEIEIISIIFAQCTRYVLRAVMALNYL